jgi:hypothetical protein
VVLLIGNKVLAIRNSLDDGCDPVPNATTMRRVNAAEAGGDWRAPARCPGRAAVRAESRRDPHRVFRCGFEDAEVIPFVRVPRLETRRVVCSSNCGKEFCSIDSSAHLQRGILQTASCSAHAKGYWRAKVKLAGTRSNRTGIGARVRVLARMQPDKPEPMTLIGEVRSGGSYYSQSDLRLHFGLDQAKTIDVIEIRWPFGQINTFRDLPVDRLCVVEEGAKEPKAFLLPSMRKV